MVELLQERMGAAYSVQVNEVTKNNGIVCTGIVMMREEDNMSPTIYLEEMYRQYCVGTALEKIADGIVELYRDKMKTLHLNMDFFRDYGKVEERIFHKLISREKNVKLLEEIPHFFWHDLAIVFYYALEEEVLGNASILIRNSHLAMWEKTAEEVYAAAESNMRRRMPELLIPMRQLVEEMTGVKTEETASVDMYVLTNRAKLNGASAMLYSEKMKELAEKLGKDLLILPSSVHEVLLLPDECLDEYDFYRQLVEEVNTTQVDPEEVLSGQLYRYNRKLEKIEEISG